MTPTMDDWNPSAVQRLLADAERALVLTELEDVRGNRGIVENTIVTARQNYFDLVRRSRPLIMSHSEEVTFQEKLDQLKARLHFFGERGTK